MQFPPKPRQVRLTSAVRAQVAGHVRLGEWAAPQWVIELPYVIQRGRPSVKREAVAAVGMRRATTRKLPCCGSHSSTLFWPSGRPANRRVVGEDH